MTLPFQPRRYPGLLALFDEEGGWDEGKRSLADVAHDRILLKIIRGELPGGTELKSTKLAEELAMSRTPVVRALARLAESGVVGQSLHLRATVRPGAENWLVDIHRVRQQLEPEAARASSGGIPQVVLEDLWMLSRDAKPGPGEGWRETARGFDQGLHLVVAEYCGNLSMRQILRQCWRYKRLSYEAGGDSEAHLRSGYRDHVRILDALRAGDGGGAFRLMERHLETAAPKTPGQRIV